MLKLSRSLSISRNCSPVVRPGDVLMHPRVDHGLDREDMPRLHETSRFIVCVMRHIRGAMEEVSNSVSTVCPIDRQSALIRKYPFYSMNLVMTLPTSRYIVPGLQIVMAFCKHSQALVTKNLLDSATCPTRQVQLRSTWKPSLQTVTSKLTISPFWSGLSSGIPWQMTSLTDVHSDLGNLQQLKGEGQALLAIMKSCTATSIASVVTPAFTKECPRSKACLASRATSFNFMISSGLLVSITFCNLLSCSFLGTDVKQQSGLGICSGIVLFLETTPGRSGPVNLKLSLRFLACSSREMWTSL